jgi:hypothetical protein
MVLFLSFQVHSARMFEKWRFVWVFDFFVVFVDFMDIEKKKIEIMFE